jgi:DNA-directed RNA polymerase subunit RPC12/RpoP
MRGYACSNCGAKPKVKMGPPGVIKTPCPVCGKSLIVKMSETETTVTAKITTDTRKRKKEYG